MNSYQKIRMLDALENSTKQPPVAFVFMVGAAFGVIGTLGIVGLIMLLKGN